MSLVLWRDLLPEEGAATGMSAFLRSRSDAGTPPADTRVVEVAVAAFSDILDSIIHRDGEGAKEHLKRSLREVTGRAREAFSEYSPMARDLSDAVAGGA